MDKPALLLAAIENNIAWCSRVCAAHGSNEELSSTAWANFAASPPFYPNIITRVKGAQSEIIVLADKVRMANHGCRWGIKDSFGELSLPTQKFERILSGNWYGGTRASGDTEGWTTVRSSTELHLWEQAWGSNGATIFPSSLFHDDRIKLWLKGDIEALQSGFISFHTESSVGLSNWFCVESHAVELDMVRVAVTVARGLPIVCWSMDDLSDHKIGLERLGPLQVWKAR